MFNSNLLSFGTTAVNFYSYLYLPDTFLRLKFTRFNFGWRSAQDCARETYSASSHTGFGEPLCSAGWRERKGEGNGDEGER